MVRFVDRRLNPKDKNLGNRRRFIKRVRATIKKAVNESVRQRKLVDMDREEKISIPSDGLAEPGFRHARQGGLRERVLPGNKTFNPGDRLKKPPGSGAGRSEGAPEGEGEDDFMFVLSREEFLDLFFDDLELPDLVKLSLKEISATEPRRAGYSVTGAPSNINVARTMRNALGRRIALKRPGTQEIRALEEEIFSLEAIMIPTARQRARLAELREELEKATRRRKTIAYIDPLDVRYNYFTDQPKPAASAVMFCLMDVSASMGEREKDLAKRFFVLLHMFLGRRYEKVDLVFIRHTHQAEEVDEETFFHSRETGGTVVSTALTQMKNIIESRYPPSDWNIYAAQASDGENFSRDSDRCTALLNNDLMKLCQYFAYIEIVDENEEVFLDDESGLELWSSYLRVAAQWPNFAMKRIVRAEDIYPVFRDLFAKRSEGVRHD